jgi:hypothetical protein
MAMNASELKTAFLGYLNQNNKPKMNDEQEKFVDFIIKKILDGKCMNEGAVIDRANFGSSHFIAVILDAFMGVNTEAIFVRLVREFAAGQLHGKGITLKGSQIGLF